MLETPTPPSGPRATRTSERLTPSRHSNRGGIQKRSGAPPVRVDKDGDVSMGTGSGSGRGNGTARRATPGRRHDPLGRSSRPTRNGIDTSTIQKTILRSMGSDEPSSRGARSSLKSVRGRGRAQNARDGLDRITVRGLKQSKAAGNPDGGVADLIGFLERKATHPDAPASEAVKIKKSRLEGDALIISVRPEDTPKITRINHYVFAGAELKIEAPPKKATPLESNADSETPNTIETLKSVLSRRYNVDSKFLDLSHLGSDPELVNIGMFSTTSRESKFFPALMKICDNIFISAKQKEEAIVSVSLANNALTNISSVTTLSQTFPAIRNLDLSNNQLGNLASMEGWRWKFRKLDHLILTGNPVEAEVPMYKEEMLKWFPSLTTLDTIQLRTPEEVKAAANGRLPIPILGPCFRDEVSIGENFVKQFFVAYDGDRASLVNGFYDAQSTFSLSVNTSAPRAPEASDYKIPGWDSYIKRSRNLTKLAHLPAQMSRLHTGTDSIKDVFSTLPVTRHPDLLAEPQKWCIECHTIAGLPDPAGQSASGVGGLIVMVHGEFSEVDVSNAQATTTRSFDRTFVLGPGAGIGGIRVACDTLVLRSYGGHDAWQPEGGTVDGNVLTQLPAVHQITLPREFAVPSQGKSEEQVGKELLVVELSKGTGMTLQWSEQCLNQSGWSLEAAAAAFEQAKSQLPAEAFVSG